jgi:leader peptidase (prepilin peptidase)/N-methyltransferase
VARFGLAPRGLIAAAFVAVLAVLAAIDIERRAIPNQIVLPAAGAVLAAQMAFFPSQAAEWTLAPLCASAGLFSLAVISPDGLGMGDVKLGLLLGAGLGRDVILALALGFVALLPVALWLLLRHGAQARKRTLALGPALAFGAIVVLALQPLG